MTHTSYTQRAIETAKKAGYDDKRHFAGDTWIPKSLQEVLLDPLFWSSLGKALNWKRPIDEETGREMLVDPWENYDQEVWKDKWHEFIDELASGNSMESFFQLILQER